MAVELPPITQLWNSLARSLKLRLVLSLKMRLGQIVYKQTDHKNVKPPVVILIVIWETETNPHSDVHKPPHILPLSNVLVCVTHGCLYRTVLVGQVV
ncbi:hypothetical protein E2C01_074114 [Portunus trituberculatus]|uniref:Uncharacterized protein n=1 Tax=Portunus trituberculatus TaxID=210409 RepID=A0A5B7ICG9_PORTR|nr:hypothetical protein [Portunus trituberculatus]